MWWHCAVVKATVCVSDILIASILKAEWISNISCIVLPVLFHLLCVITAGVMEKALWLEDGNCKDVHNTDDIITSGHSSITMN
jgi:hypothetical protein